MIKKMLTSFMLFGLVHLGADEIERINNLIKEVKKLRMNYTTCRHQLIELSKNKERAPQDRNTHLYATWKQQQAVLTRELEQAHQNERNLKDQIQSLQEALKAKEQALTALQTKNDSLTRKIEALQNELYRKKQKQEPVKNDANTSRTGQKKQPSVETLHYTKPKTFRTNKEAPIYDAKNGKQIATWEAHRSFTSNIESGDWIKITGYFIDRVWTPAKRNLWIKKEDAYER